MQCNVCDTHIDDKVLGDYHMVKALHNNMHRAEFLENALSTIQRLLAVSELQVVKARGDLLTVESAQDLVEEIRCFMSEE